jgi:hypothetical protein
MRRQFDKRIKVGSSLVAERNRISRMEKSGPSLGPIKKTRPKGQSFRTVISKVVQFLGLRRKLEPWEVKAIAAAEDKRARRRERNVRWWSNDPNWEYYGG